MTTARQARKSHFQKGSALYACRVCGHNTRDTGGDGAGVQLCDLCYGLAGEENSVSDSGTTYQSAENVRAECAALDARNGAGTAQLHFPTVCEAAQYLATLNPPKELPMKLDAQALDIVSAKDKATASSAPRKEAPGVTKRSSAFFVDPRCIGRREGFNPRIDFGDLDGLAASIKANGILNPLRIQRVPPGTEGGKLFVLVDGDRRLTAIEKLLKAGHEFPEGVPATLVDKAQGEATSLIQMFVANDGKPFTPIEEAMAYGKMRDAGMTIKQICEAVGRKQVHVTEILNLLNADDSVKDAVKDGSIGKTMAKQIATQAKGDAGKQAELVSAAKAAGKDAKAKKIVRKALDDQRRAKAAKKGKVLKMRALDDAALGALGKQVAEAMAEAMKNAGKPLDFDLAEWVKLDDKLALAATYGALEALKAAAGMNIDLKF